MAMRPLARLRHQLSPSLLRLHGPRHGWPPASDATFLWRGLASSPPSAAREKSSRRTLGYLLGVAVAMVGASYAAVPLYRRFCQATGYGGTTQRRESVEEKISRHARDGTTTSREIIVQFNADVADGMPWKFIPTQREVRVKPGESALAFYTAENRSSAPITGVSTYNVAPMKHIGMSWEARLVGKYRVLGSKTCGQIQSHRNGVWRLRFTSIRYNVSASRSKHFFLENRLTCQYSSISIQSLRQTPKWTG